MFTNKNEMIREMEEHMGIECQEYGPLTPEDRMVLILYETVRHIPKHEGPKKGRLDKAKLIKG